ncbi:MAG: class I SAM-dependent methyltransferase [Acidobacteria bacterium]|nr:class I SAM-dependent methyltransferase [Acidobacteriota bacterium]
MAKSHIRTLPSLELKGHESSRSGGPDHPMRAATRRAAGLDNDGWTSGLRDEVGKYFDGLSGEWQTRTTPERIAIVEDALDRGCGAVGKPDGLAVELGSGTGAYSGLLAKRFGKVVSLDLSMAMLRLAPTGPASRVQADGSALPFRDGNAAAIILINAFLFPLEVARVLGPDGVVVWVNSSGEHTPIYLSVDDLVAALPGDWTGVASQAGEGSWCVLRRASAV